MEEEAVVQALVALGHPVRLKVFRALVVSGTPGLTPGVMQEGLGIPATTLSFHLKEMSGAKLITMERMGRNLVYRAAYERVNGVLTYLTDNCCEGAACALEPVSVACDC
jgi:DNA-binding transcriptional ArsR family regulator